jgi:hypothetical protein
VLYCNVTGENAATISWVKYNGSASFICSFGTASGVCPSYYNTTLIYSNSALIGTTLTITGVDNGDFTIFGCSGSSQVYFNLTQLGERLILIKHKLNI